ncbi:MSCRAMM family protein [Nocardioides yefusunii]|uniref:Collagen binding domain-containing protein n=1 Tax=Nocardioides yefusunii TaxID=2500546 RepID=A0ABW1QXM7_9ACTN|nr:hypothetical protein [Nocardioides yefusunii]
MTTTPLVSVPGRRSARSLLAALVSVALLLTSAALLLPSAVAAETRLVSGSVVLPVGVSPDDVEVRASSRSLDPETGVPRWSSDAESGLALLGEAWVYQLRVPAGEYVIGAVDFGSRAAPTWYPSVPSEEEGSTVTVGAFDVVLGALRLQAFSSIGGIVQVPAAAAHRNVSVHAFRRTAAGTWQEEAEAAVDEDGAYRVLDLRAGTYRLQFSYAGVAQSGGWYAGPGRAPVVQRDKGADVVLGPATDLDTVDVVLGKGADVTGRLRTVAGAAVTAKDVRVSAYEAWTDPWGVRRWRPVVTVGPAGNGTYAIRGLPAGTYRIGVEDRPGRYFAVFHPGASTVDSARSLTLADGSTLRSVDFTLDRGTTVKGKVTVPTGIATTSVRADLLQKVGTTWKATASTWVGADGKYALTGVPAGNYRVALAHDSGALTPWFVGKDGPVSALGAARTVTVGRSASLTFDAVLTRRGTPLPQVKVVSRPGLRGTARVGRTLTVKGGRYSPSGTTVKYQWFMKKGSKVVAIKGATKRSVKLPKATKGRTVRLRVTVSRPTHRPVRVTTRWSRAVRR